MFNATVAGSAKTFLRTECINDSRAGSRAGSACNVNEVEWGAARKVI